MTDYRSLYDKDFIGAWDLTDGDLTVTIKKCVGGSLTGPGGRKSKKPVIYMTHTEKGFALNATNGKTIAAMYGNHVEKWAGKRITLYKSMTRSPQGDGDVECIRVRPNVREDEDMAPKAAAEQDNKAGIETHVSRVQAPSSGSLPNTSGPAPSAALQSLETALSYAPPVTRNRLMAKLAAKGVRSLSELTDEQIAPLKDWVQKEIDRAAEKTT